MSATLTFSRSIPVRRTVDVFVAGGGPSGVAAAVTAARAGASVFLAEGATCLGGMGTSAGLPMFCSPTDGVNLTSAGFGSDVYERLEAAGGTLPETRGKPVGQFLFAFNPEVLKRVYDDLAVESHVDFSLQTQFLDVQREGSRVQAAVCSGKSGLFAVQARQFVDATGDGDLCACAGAAFRKGDEHGEMQPPTLLSLWSNIDWAKANANGCGVWQYEKKLPQAIADGVFTVPDRHLPGLIPISARAAWGNVGHLFGTDGTDERSLTQAYVRGRKLVLEYERYFKQYHVGFEAMELLGTGALLGVRETRRIQGDYELNLADFQRRAVFEDEIGRFSYPVDLHATRPDQETYEKFEREFAELRYKAGESYGIPYRCLLPKGLDNVLVAGRCVSCDRHIQGSLRVMPACFITGQAAGMAAALAAGSERLPRQLDVEALQECLASMGAYLPNRRVPRT